MLDQLLNNQSEILVISTGNVLNVNKKAGQKADEELLDCLKITIGEPRIDLATRRLYRMNDDLLDKISEHERSDIKIGAKLFLNEATTIHEIKEALDSFFDILNVSCVDNIVVSMGGDKSDEDGSKVANDGIARLDKNELQRLKEFWKLLESYASEKKINQLGIADLHTETFIELYNFATIKPTIIQINLTACCVVPPALQEFCTTNDIQLLTHSDPEDIVNTSNLETMNISSHSPLWTIRYQVHLKCRGVLTAKGYIVGIKRIK